MARSIMQTVCDWLAFVALYLIFAGAASASEFWLAPVAGAIAVTLLALVRLHSRHHFQVKLKSLGKLCRVPLQMLVDCAIVFRAILQRPWRRRGGGRFELRLFKPGNEHPAVRGRRALVTLGISCAPNSIALGPAAPNDELLVHQLVPQKETARDPEWPL